MTLQNQCDGCMAGMMVQDGTHYTRRGNRHQKCTAGDYGDPVPAGFKLHALTCNGRTIFLFFPAGMTPRITHATVQRLLGLREQDCIMPRYLSPFPRLNQYRD